MESITLEISKIKSRRMVNKKQALVTAAIITVIWLSAIFAFRYMYLTALGNLVSK